MIKDIFIDFDGTIFNTIKSIVRLYNQDYCTRKDFKPVHWTEINSWDFVECVCATKDEINAYFEDVRFFSYLEYIDNRAKLVLNKLSKKYNLYIVSMGSNTNLALKKEFLAKELPMCNFIPVDEKDYSDKSHIDMSNGILIDDCAKNLITSNAYMKIIFGDIYPWNKSWEKKGLRCYNWTEVSNLILGEDIFLNLEEKKMLIDLICNEQTHMIMKDCSKHTTDDYMNLEALKIKIKDI